MNSKTDLFCDHCGGPVRTTYSHCIYCGGPVVITRLLSDGDRNKMRAFALMIDNAFYRISTLREHKLNRYFVVPNLILLLGLAISIYYTTNSVTITGIPLGLLSYYIYKNYHEDYKYAFLQIADDRVYKRIFKPAVEQFLGSYNYPGYEWERVINDLNAKGQIIWFHKFLGEAKDPQGEEQKVDAVLRFFDTTLSRYIAIRRRKRRSRFYLFTGYFITITISLFALASPYTWIPLIWVIPSLIFLYLEMTLTTFVLVGLPIIESLKYCMEPSFMHEEIMPLMAEFCMATGHDTAKMEKRARELELFYLYYNLENIPDKNN